MLIYLPISVPQCIKEIRNGALLGSVGTVLIWIQISAMFVNRFCKKKKKKDKKLRLVFVPCMA